MKTKEKIIIFDLKKQKELEEIIKKSKGSPKVYVERVGKKIRVIRINKKNNLFPTIVKNALKDQKIM